jgi:hypothetical protein
LKVSYNSCAVASRRIHVAIGLNVCASPPPLCRTQESAITFIKNSLVEIQSTIHYYYSTCAVAEYAPSNSVNKPSIDTFICIRR